MIKFHCPHCNQKIGLDDNYAGKRVRCAKCKQPLQVPGAVAQPAAGKPITDAGKPDKVTFNCWNCGQRIAVGAIYIGKSVKCPKCAKPIQVPSTQQPAVQKKPAAPAVTDDDAELAAMFGDNLANKEMLAAEANAPSVEEPLRIAPLSSESADGAQNICPRCGTLNPIGTQFCAGCEYSFTAPAAGAGPGTGFLVGLAASIGFALVGVIVWTILAGLIGYGWMNFLCVGVAVLAGLGFKMALDERGPGIGTLAILIGLAGIFLGKVCIAKWVVLPRMESEIAAAKVEWEKAPDKAVLSEEEIMRRMNDPNEMFRAAAYQMADEGTFSKEFAEKVVQTQSDGRAPIGEAEKILAGVKQVGEKISGWTDEQKRQAIIAQGRRDVQAFQELGRTMMEKAFSDSNVPKGFRRAIEEANSVSSGDMKISETSYGFTVAFIRALECSDLLLLPLALFCAYKAATG